MLRTTIALSIALAPLAASADATPPTLRLSIEADPLDYTVFDGWGAFTVIRPAAWGPWALRLGGGAAYPPKVLAEANGNTGWRFGYDPVATVAVQRYFSDARGGWLATVVLGGAKIDYTGPSGGKTSVFQLQAQAGAAYRWYPFADLGLVVTPYLTLAGPLYQSKSPTVDGKTYDTFPVVLLPEIMVGYDFAI